MDRKELIKKYIEFFERKKHKKIHNSSLIPENDPTVLFTTAGMQPIVPYLLGQKHPEGKRLVNVQRCIRTVDINEVGDTYHHTFFEMLGNWSLGDYWKEDAIKYSLEFLTKILKIPIERLAVSCFKGDEHFKKDSESAKIWESLNIPKKRIAFLPESENWWGPAGETGPCGPSTEMFFWKSSNPIPEEFDPENENWVEIGNDVLMEYQKNKEGKYKKAEQKNIDFGGGVERTVTVLNGLEDNYLSDSFLPIINKIEKITGKTYGEDYESIKAMRIIADHIKAAVFILADGITPSNSEQGYVLRRLIRRTIRYGRKLNLKHFTKKIAYPIFTIYDDYKHLKENKEKILKELEKEEEKFLETLGKGMNMLNKVIKNKKDLSGKEAFLLYQSYGFPIEITKEIAEEKGIAIDEKGFEIENKKHQNLSRTATEGKFKSGLADSGEETTKLHTATHLLHAALRTVLGKDVQQKGSNITPERLRFDFVFNRKLTDLEKEEIEKIVNKAIKKKYPVNRKEVTPEKAKEEGALGFFEHKYGNRVSVYTIGTHEETFSKEICAGPHVTNTSELGEIHKGKRIKHLKFRIIKEESSSAGVRRIKAELTE